MEQIYFSLNNILTVVWVALGVSLLSMLWLLTAVRNRLMLCVKAAASADAGWRNDADTDNLGDDRQPSSLPGVSVIVYATDNPESLTRLLDNLFNQDYVGKKEIIVVNDGSSSDVTDVVNRLGLDHPELYQTFVPDEAHNLSRKKLGISLGVKAARYPYVVLTCDNCMPLSASWLSCMARPFAGGKDVALGYASVKGLKKSSDIFDEVVSAVVWLTAALRRHPYRGIGYNIGYKKSLFFDVKGFSRSLTLHNGDDDLFVNQITDGGNTAVVLSPDSLVEVNAYNPRKLLRESRLNHSFTARFLPKGSGRFFGFATITLWLWLAATTVGIVFSLPNALPACLFLLTVPGLLIPMSLAWGKTAGALGIRLSSWGASWHMFWRWIRNLRYSLACGSASRRNYTWLQH